MRHTNHNLVGALLFVMCMLAVRPSYGQYAEYVTGVQPPPGALTAAPVDYGTGRALGMDACQYELKDASEYDDSRDTQRIKARDALVRSKRSKIKKAERALRKQMADAKKAINDTYHLFFDRVASSSECTSKVDVQIPMTTDLYGPAASESPGQENVKYWANFCAQGVYNDTAICSAIVRTEGPDRLAAPDCVSMIAQIREEKAELAEEKSELKEQEDALKALRDEVEEANEKRLEQALSTEGLVCPTGDCDDQPRKVPAWAWGAAIGADLLFNYGIKRAQDKDNKRDALYRARLGFPPYSRPRWLPGPVTTMGLAQNALYGAGAGAHGCGPGYFNGGFPNGPAGMFGNNGIYAGFYGNSCGGAFGYPCGWNGQGYPGYNGYPGYGGGPGGWNGGIPGWGAGGGAGGFPGGFPGGYPGGFPGGYPGGFPGGYPGGFPGGYPGGFPGGGIGGFPGGFPGGGPGGFPGGGLGGSQWQMEMQQRMMQVQMEYYQREMQNQQNRQAAVGQISNQIYQLQMQLAQIQGSAGGMYGAGGYNGGATWGGAIGGGLWGGIGGIGGGIWGSIGGGYNWGGGYLGGSQVPVPVLPTPAPGTGR